LVAGVQMTSRIVEGLFGALRKTLRFIRIAFVPLIKSISVIIIIALILSGMSLLISISLGSPVIRIFGPESTFINHTGIISLFFLVAAPIFGLIAFFLRIAFKTKVKREVNFTIWTIWFIALFFTFYSGTMMAIDYNHKGLKVSTSDFTLPTDEIVIKTWKENVKLSDISPYVDVPLKFFKDSMFFRNVHVEYKETDSLFVTIRKEVEARGFNHDKAQERANQTDAPFTIVGNEILISPLVRMPKDAKWRGNQVRYTIFVPKGKKVIYDFTQGHNNSFHVGWKD
jgi:hypothetical protein